VPTVAWLLTQEFAQVLALLRNKNLVTSFLEKLSDSLLGLENMGNTISVLCESFECDFLQAYLLPIFEAGIQERIHKTELLSVSPLDLENMGNTISVLCESFEWEFLQAYLLPIFEAGIQERIHKTELKNCTFGPREHGKCYFCAV
jgi:hypothetical protein